VSDRVILAVKFTPVSTPSKLRKAVGGFLRYIQYRDKHADMGAAEAVDPKVAGLLKYVAYRDQAARTGRLFGPDGPVGDAERRRLAGFVTRSVAGSRPQMAPDEKGGLLDRRRAVYRFVLSPEHAEGLDLGRLTEAAVGRLEAESGARGLRWIAAEHRNTAHPHVHLILAAYSEEAPDRFRPLVLNRRRLAAMKDALTLEIARQREGGREAFRESPAPRAQARAFVWPSRLTQPPVRQRARNWSALPGPYASAFIRLQAVAHRYQRMVEREAEEERTRRLREVERS